MEETVIQVNGLCKAYGGRTVLRDLSLSVERGVVFGLLGANGAGKTTAIECMLGIRKPDRGTVSILGLDPRARRKQLFQQVGVQFQESSYQREVRVGELCRETASLYRRPADWESLLAEFGLEGREKSLVKDLSGGQRQRLFVILALLPSPSAVFLDELTTGLDVKARRTVWRVLEERKRKGLTIPADLPLYGRGGSPVRHGVHFERGSGRVSGHGGAGGRTEPLRIPGGCLSVVFRRGGAER